MSDIRTIDAYIAEVRAHLAPLGASQRDEVLAELESLLRSDAERAGEAAALEAVGDPAVYAAGVLDANGGASDNWMWLVVLGVLAVPFFMLYVPTRAGLHAEWREAIASDGEGD